MNRLTSFIAVTFLLAAASAQAAPQLFTVSINTSSLLGSAAYLDFNFGAASVSADAGSLTISGFNGDATLGASSVLFGNVAGTLPSNVVLDNQPSPGAYYSQALTLGSSIAFNLILDGDLVNGPTGGPDGSSFAVWLLDESFLPLLSLDALFVVDIDGLGQITLTNQSTETSVDGPTPIPEPASYALMGAGLAGLMMLRRRSA